MSSNRIKVLGYAQKVVYNNSIEYTPFTPDLVGLQLASNGGTPLFTMGNFYVTTNLDSKVDKIFVTNNFSQYTTLNSINSSLQSSIDILTNNNGVILNLDKRELKNYVLFNSLSEYVRVALESIITNWPASLYVTPIYSLPPDYYTQSGITFQNYVYNPITQVSTFMVSTNVVVNNFQLNYLAKGSLQNTFNAANTVRNVALNYKQYSISYGGNEYPVIGFTGSTYTTNDFINISVSGDCFSGMSNGYLSYHIKPNKVQEDFFFNSLPDFQYYLLNRFTAPKFTAQFNFTVKTDSGAVVYTKDSVTWPTSDGYNIDFDTDAYTSYANRLLTISTDFDGTTSNLMVRFLVTESITEFDTSSVILDPYNQDSTDKKMNKTLTVYGVEFDEINRFIQGIRFVNTVSYDKNDNTPDIYLKSLANILGWNLVSSILENDLLKNYLHPQPTTYAGQSVGLTMVEADTELWRRIILNSPWIWKSKGTRKAIEFLFKFIGTPQGLITFNEYVYVAQNVIDMDVFTGVLKLNNLNPDISTYPVSISGNPKPLYNTPSLYFQSKGLWYRETGGQNSTLDITTGNNPHIGPYDGGYAYINQFKKLIPNFSAVTISSSTQTTDSINIFTNYNSGTFDLYSGGTYINIIDSTNTDVTNNSNITIIDDPYNRLKSTCFGCPKPNQAKAVSILIKGN